MSLALGETGILSSKQPRATSTFVSGRHSSVRYTERVMTQGHFSQRVLRSESKIKEKDEKKILKSAQHKY